MMVRWFSFLTLLLVPLEAQFRPIFISDDGVTAIFWSELWPKGRSVNDPRAYEARAGYPVQTFLSERLTQATWELPLLQGRGAGNGRYFYWSNSGFQRSSVLDAAGREVVQEPNGQVIVDPSGSWVLRTSFTVPGMRRIRLEPRQTDEPFAGAGASAGLLLPIPGSITSDGTVAALRQERPVNGTARDVLVLSTPGQPLREVVMPRLVIADHVYLSANGRYAAYLASNAQVDGAELRVLDLQLGGDRLVVAQRLQRTTLGQEPRYSDAIRQVYLTPDSRTLFYEDERFTFSTPLAGGEVTRTPLSFRDSVFSSNGEWMLAADIAGGLFKYRLRDRVLERVLAPSPLVRLASVAAVPGSLLRIPCEGCSDRLQEGAVPLAPNQFGVSLALGGLSVPVRSVSPSEVVVQVPWETVSGGWRLTTGAGEFEGAPEGVMQVSTARPSFELLSADAGLFRVQGQPQRSAAPKLMHFDWRGFVSESDPARSGEVLHLYMLGLGPVTNRPKTGELPAVNALAQVTEPFSCSWGLPAGRQQAEILFAGLVPGEFPGVYQVEIRAPQVTAAQGTAVPVTALQCEVAGGRRTPLVPVWVAP